MPVTTVSSAAENFRRRARKGAGTAPAAQIRYDAIGTEIVAPVLDLDERARFQVFRGQKFVVRLVAVVDVHALLLQ